MNFTAEEVTAGIKAANRWPKNRGTSAYSKSEPPEGMSLFEFGMKYG